MSRGSIRGGLYDISVVLSAGVPQYFKGLGSKVFHLLEASNAVTVKFQGSNSGIDFYQGMGFSHESDDNYFDNIEIVSTTTQTIKFLYGNGRVNDFRATVTGAVSANVAIANSFETASDVSCNGSAQTQIASADSDTLAVVVSNPSTNSSTFRIGDGDTGASRGDILEPGMTKIYSFNDDLYAYNNGSTESLAVNYLKNV